MAAREASYIFEPVFEGADRQRGLDAIRAVLRAPMTKEVALRLSEAHQRDCVTCSVGGPDGLCLDGRWHQARVERAMGESRCQE